MADLFDIERETRVSGLAALIKKYQDSYYNGEGEISDAEFDKLWDELRSLDPENPVLRRVGADSGNFAKARHIMPMGSQEKAADPQEFLAWAKNHPYDEYLVEHKLDGASLELQYSHGELVRAVTRGDGVIGDDITSNARRMRGVMAGLFDGNGGRIDFTGAVRGEVLMTRSVRERFYSDKANCRNAANGLMRRKDGSGSENLLLMAYDALSTGDGAHFSDEEEKILWLRKCGFMTSPLRICGSALEVIDYRAEVMESRKDLDYDIDGLVVKERRIDLADASRARPERQIAFKFSLEEAVSVLREVEWSESGATYTPVALFDEVQLNGTTVQRASLANPCAMRSLGVRIGSRILVVKRGEIIPKIERVLPDEEGQETEEIVFPDRCSVCGTALIDEGSRLYCPNRSCPKRVLHQIQKWVDVVDIRDLGDTLIRELFNDKEISSISDIYGLTEERLAPYFLNEESMESRKDSLGARKVFESIQSRRRMPLSVFVAGFDIEGIGEIMVKKLVDSGLNTLEGLLSATEDEIASVYGFARITAGIFAAGLSENAGEMRSLVRSGTIVIEEAGAGLLAGKSFCFTGELRAMKRADAESLVRKSGGTCKSSVTKDLSYLVTNDTGSGSGKNQKARKFGIPVIDEDEFLRLLGQPGES